MGLFGPPNVEKMKTNGDIKGLIKALGYRKDVDVRKAAADALERIADPRAVEPFIAALKDSELYVRRKAADALWKIGDARAVEPLIAALKDGDVILCLKAAEALGKIGDARAVEPFIAALKDSDSNLHRKAAELLVKMGDARAVEPLIAALKDSDPETSRRAAEALGKMGDARAVEPLIAALKDSDPETSWRAAAALGMIGDARAVEPLIAALEVNDPNIRYEGVEALGKIGDARAIEPLAAALAEGYLSAAVVLVKLGWQPGNDQASAIYWISQKEWSKCVSIGSLAVGPLVAALRSEDGKTRVSVAEALGKIGDPRAIPALRLVLRETNFKKVDHYTTEYHSLNKMDDDFSWTEQVLDHSEIVDEYADAHRAAEIALKKLGSE